MWIIHKPSSPFPRNEREFEGLLADLFRKQGWGVKKEPIVADKGVDFLVAHGDQRYLVECKVASEGRPDRLIPLLSQAILQVRAYARALPETASPLAIIAAPAISLNAANSLVSFLSQFAPDVAVGIIDREGLGASSGPGSPSSMRLRLAPPADRSCLCRIHRIYFPILASG